MFLCFYGVSHIIDLCLFLNRCLFQVYTTKRVLPKKQRLMEEGEEEEPDRKRVKTEVADTVEVKLESHPQVHKVDMF